ncbi:hypothetical protein ZRA01_22690 [Zoogloea ramigera]|uniref:DUF4154 domain-containing protein n=1 Tax=Zoogloea ramigera TaxID=350 RepID=A0A4Y4CV40_ZOORA|nr:YfiR family protein [Zoogloea ramigera]GEC96196.1 hypothetical protein ZRA01_22690 [Zoogloea ramigera]
MGRTLAFSPGCGRRTWRAVRLRRVAAALCGAGLALALLQPLAAGAQAVPEPQLRAAYLVNFLKYVEWPGGGVTATICLYGRDTLSAYLAPYEGRSVQGRELRVRRIFQFDQLADCQELYVAETDEERQAAVIKAAARLPVLTVGETAAFVQQGGALALLRQDGRIVFDVNMSVVTRAGLRVSPQMLRLARDVSGGAR